MKNVIYSFYIDIEPNNSKHTNTKNKLKSYYSDLLNVKKDYAKKCNAEFIMFGQDEVYDKFKSKYNLYEFDTLNFYKHFLYENLFEKYDNILYLDFDVIPNTNQSFFEEFDMSKINVRSVNSTVENTWPKNTLIQKNEKRKTYDYIIDNHFDKYSMYIKALAKQSMLFANDIYDVTYEVINTGIICASSEQLKKIQLMKNLNNLIKTLYKAKDEKYFGNTVSSLYEPNNETFFTYLLEKNNIEWNNLPKTWHDMIMENDNVTNSKILHVINKKFEGYFNAT
jgi:hypothetical protein